MTINLYHLVKLRKNSMLHQIHLEHGLKKKKSDTLELETVKEKDYIISKMLKKYFTEINYQLIKRKSFVMQEYLQIIRKKILNDKLNSYKKLIKKLKSFSTLVLDLISKEKVLKPFWNEYTKEKSKKLWLPIKTDCVDLDLKLSNGFLKNQIQNSWFSTNFQVQMNQEHLNSQKTYYQLQQSSSQETTEIDQLNIENKEKKKRKRKKKKQKKSKTDNFNSIKLRIYPTKEQKITLEKWFGVSRFIYNKCLYYINNERNKPNYDSKEVLNEKNLRKLFINNENYKTENSWMLDFNYDLRDESMRDLKHNFKTNFCKKEFFKIKYKTKRSSKSLSVLSKHWGHKKGFYSSIFNNKLKCEKQLPDKLDYDSRIIKTEANEYYICIPRKISCENQTTKNIRVISIDPGVRTFLTGYDPEGKIIEIGKNDIGYLSRLNHYKSKLQSKIKKASCHNERYKLKKRYIQMCLKIKNTVDDCHKKVCKWLCKNYDIIIIPKLNFHNFSSLSKRNKRNMILWGHCMFVDRLIDKSREYYKCKVDIITEEYTSKTCGCCGLIKTDLYASKVYNCNRCNNVFDRDSNGARNILLKFYTETK